MSMRRTDLAICPAAARRCHDDADRGFRIRARVPVGHRFSWWVSGRRTTRLAAFAGMGKISADETARIRDSVGAAAAISLSLHAQVKSGNQNMLAPMIRISLGTFDAEKAAIVEAKLTESKAALEAGICAMRGNLGYYAGIDRKNNAMSNVSIWESIETAEQMATFQPMIILPAHLLPSASAFNVPFSIVRLCGRSPNSTLAARQFRHQRPQVGTPTDVLRIQSFRSSPAIPATSVCICAPAGSAEAGAVAVFDRLAR